MASRKCSRDTKEDTKEKEADKKGRGLCGNSHQQLTVHSEADDAFRLAGQAVIAYYAGDPVLRVAP